MPNIHSLSWRIAPFIFSVTLISPIATANDDAASCAKTNTITMCVAKRMANDGNTVPVTPRKAVFVQENELYVVVGDERWLKHLPDKPTPDSISLVLRDGRGFVGIDTQTEPLESPRATALEAMSAHLKALKSGPEEIDIPWAPWIENGVVYRVCYKTTKNTTECLFSAAANLSRRSVKFLGYVESDAGIAQSTLDLIASVGETKQ